ncbi:MAG: hypothetical protein Q8O94_02890 [bacterium]|nr:hypothetical protein [bacterium]
MIEAKKIVFIDVDGVLADFVSGVQKLFKFDPSDLKHYDIPAHLGMDHEFFWKSIQIQKKHFWRDLNVLPGAESLMETIFLSNCKQYLCTSVRPWPEAFAGRLEWVQRWFPGFQEHLIYIKDKALLARDKNTILIDDYIENVKSFKHAGGAALLYPATYNPGVTHEGFRMSLEKVLV